MTTTELQAIDAFWNREVDHVQAGCVTMNRRPNEDILRECEARRSARKQPGYILTKSSTTEPEQNA